MTSKHLLRHIYCSLALILPWATCCITSCSGSRSKTAMTRAEALMEEHPDSALSVLNSIDPLRLSSEERALHSLLLTEARYKSGVDESDDSLISSSVDFFKSEKDSPHRWKAYYYKGIIDNFSNDYGQALISLMHAERTAGSLADTLKLALTHRAMADVFDKTKNKTAALRYYKLSLSEFEHQDDEEYTDFARFDVCRTYSILGMTDSCLNLAEEIERIARLKNDTSLLRSSLGIIGEALVMKGDYSEAMDLFSRKKELGPLSAYDWTKLGEAYLGVGNIAFAEECRQRVDSMGNDSSWLSYRISKENGRTDEAMSYLASNLRLNDSIYRDWITRVQEQTLFDNHRLAVANINIQREKNSYLRAALILAGILIIGIIVIAVRKIRHLIRERERNVETILNMESELRSNAGLLLKMKKELEIKKKRLEAMVAENSDRDRDIRRLEQANSEQDNKIKIRDLELHNLREQLANSGDILKKRTLAIQEKDRIIRESVSTQFSTLDRLAVLYYETKDTSSEKRRIHDAVIDEISRIRDNKVFIAELEATVDSRLDNLMHDFRIDCSECKEWAIQLFLFSVLDFSVKSVCIFQNVSESVVYNRRHTLKKIISSKDEVVASKYLPFL